MAVWGAPCVPRLWEGPLQSTPLGYIPRPLQGIALPHHHVTACELQQEMEDRNVTSVRISLSSAEGTVPTKES